MEFTVPQARLSAALARASTATGRGRVEEILSSILLRATKDGVVVTATDMQVGFTELIPCTVAGKGSIVIKASNLVAMVKTLPSGDVTAKALDNSWLHLTAPRSEVKLMGMSAGEFPELPEPGGVEFIDVQAAVLVDLIGRTLFSASTDEARVNLNGALFESNGKTATMVSTDGHRLTKYSTGLRWRKLKQGIIVPRRGLDDMRRLLSHVEGECSIGTSDGHLFVRADGITISVKLTNATFPPYQQVIPASFKTKATVNRSDLLAALRQAVVIAPNKTQTVKLTVTPSQLVIQAQNDQLGAVRLEVDSTWTGKGEINVGINGEYLADSLSVVDSQDVELRFQSELDPVVVVPVSDPPQDLTLIVMPMRL